jgi:DcaP outer membrane protein
MKKLVLLSGLFISAISFSQEKPKEEKPYKVDIYGFARVDYIFDTRQSAQVREYHLNLYPLEEKLDANNDDINAANASNFLSVVSRLGVKASGPDVWGAKVSGVLEGDFFGNTQQSTGLFRLRHAYAKLAWEKTSITMGQTWYPQFIPDVFPGVANFSTGIMFNPFGWATQARLDQKLNKNFTFTAIAYKDREFGTSSIDGNSNSPSYNSSIPALHGKIEFRNTSVIAGLGAEYHPYKPLIESAGKTTDATVNGKSFLAYLKYNTDKFHVKLYTITGENLHNFVMLGGYAGYTQAGGQETYKGIKTTAGWIDIASNGKSIAPGLFIGYSKNGGSDKNGLAAGETVKYYTRGNSGTTRVIDNVYRISGRVDFKQNKFRITPELEYTAASWGDMSAKGNYKADGNDKDVANFRAMISCVYSF